MSLIVLALIASAVALQIWARLTPTAQTKIITKAKAMLQHASDVAAAVRNRLFRRRMSYRAVFLNDQGKLSPAGAVVIAHMSQFCYALSTTAMGEADRDAIMRREGRRQVWIELMKQLNLEPGEALQAMQEEQDLLAA